MSISKYQVEEDLLGSAKLRPEDLQREQSKERAYFITVKFLDVLKQMYLLGHMSFESVCRQAYTIVYPKTKAEQRRWLLKVGNISDFELSKTTKDRLLGEFLSVIGGESVTMKKGRPRLKGTPLGQMIQEMVGHVRKVDGVPISRETKKGDTVFKRVSHFFIICGLQFVSPSAVEELYMRPKAKRKKTR